jgi:hypothetical protein
MANVFAPTAGRVAAIANSVGHAKIVVTVTSVSYSSGFEVDFFTPFNDLGVNAKDVIEITGYTVDGYLANFSKGTLSATASPWTCRLWNGVTEGTGTMSVTLHVNVFFHPGAKA